MREEGKKQSKEKGNSSSFTMCRNAFYFFLQNKRKKRSKKKENHWKIEQQASHLLRSCSLYYFLLMKTSRRSSNKLVIYQGVALSTIYLLLLLPFNGTVRTSELLNKYYYLNGPDLISNHSSSAVPLTTGYTPRVVGAYPSVAFHY